MFHRMLDSMKYRTRHMRYNREYMLGGRAISLASFPRSLSSLVECLSPEMLVFTSAIKRDTVLGMGCAKNGANKHLLKV